MGAHPRAHRHWEGGRGDKAMRTPTQHRWGTRRWGRGKLHLWKETPGLQAWPPEASGGAGGVEAGVPCAGPLLQPSSFLCPSRNVAPSSGLRTCIKHRER